MKKQIFIILVLAISQMGMASEEKKSDCARMYQAWLFNSVLEEACKLDRCVSYEMGVLTKSACGAELTESVRNELSRNVLVASKKDIDALGQAKFCAANKQGHEDLRVSMKTCTSVGSKPEK